MNCSFNYAIKARLLLHLLPPGAHKDDRTHHPPGRKRQKESGRGRAADRGSGREIGIHFQDLIKSRPHPVPLSVGGELNSHVYMVYPPPSPATTASLAVPLVLAQHTHTRHMESVRPRHQIHTPVSYPRWLIRIHNQHEGCL